MILCWRPPFILLPLLISLAISVHSKWFWTNSTQDKKTVRWTTVRKLTFREKTRDLWNHAFDNYMKHAFPMDELRPLSCTGRGPDIEDPDNWAVNDVAGNFSVTLIDVLDTFVIMNDRRGFAQAVQNTLIAIHSFDLDTKPQIFETNIRILGGLLSAHQFASNPKHKFHLKWYKGELLNLAYDLGQRLLPAFNTPTGIPYARINLRHGILYGESMETCTAGAGSLIVEFGVLSRLTGDARFEKAAYKAYFAIWNRRSDIGLVGNTINAWTGAWLSPDVTGIGAGVDSFYEYALKWYILSGEVEFLDVWNEAYSNVMRYVRGREGYLFRQVDMRTGNLAYASIDSLSAFWSGLQVLSGDVQNAIKSHLIYWNLWRRFSGMPEVFDLNTRLPTSWQYPLRPEFIESTYLLYRATQDTFYLDVGERVLSDIIMRAKVDCGLASIENLLTNKRDDRMESFAIAETLKYLYLLFDEDNTVHHDDSNAVWTTEGHLIGLPKEHIRPIPAIRRQLRRVEKLQCPAYNPTRQWRKSDHHLHELTGSIRSREDAEFARMLVSTGAQSTAADDDSAYWMRDGWCDSPWVDVYSWDFVLSPDGSIVPEDFSPDRTKLKEVQDGFIIYNITGIRAHITSRMDGTGYDITKLGPYAVRTGQKVYINDDAVNIVQNVQDEHYREPTIRLHFYIHPIDPVPFFGSGLEVIEQEATVTGFTSLFAGDPSYRPRGEQTPLRFSGERPLHVIRPSAVNSNGCSTYTEGSIHSDSVLFVNRGDCTFLQKLVMGHTAGAAGVLVASDTDIALNPTAEPDELEYVRAELSDVALVVINQSEARVVSDLLESASTQGIDVFMSVDHDVESSPPQSSSADTEPSRSGRLVYVNGRPIINAELLV